MGIPTYEVWNSSLTKYLGIVKAGAPSIGPDPNDSHIWYFNGTPSACVQVGLDYVLPRYANFSVPDLVLSGPNYGLNLGPFLYTLAGTLGATYTAVERGIPAIGYSGGYSVQTAYYHVNETTKAGLKDPATIYGQLAADLAQQLITNVAKNGGGRLLPFGYGINVNIPYITSFVNDSCVAPPYVLTRMTGGAVVDKAVYNETTGLFKYGDLVTEGTNTCINGDCSLPGETDVLESGCKSSVSVFTTDYDAPIKGECGGGKDVRSLLEPLVGSGNTTVKGNGTVSVGTPTASPVSGGVGRNGLSWVVGVVGVVGCLAFAL